MILAMPQGVPREAKESFEELFRRLYRPVFGIFAKKGYSREDCQDLTSQTFLRAFKSFDDFRGEAKALTWLHRVYDIDVGSP